MLKNYLKWKKVRNFLRFPVTPNEVIAFMKAHMVQVCGKSCEEFDLEKFEFVELGQGCDMAIVYFWSNIFWEFSLDRSIVAYTPEVAKLRYRGERFAFSELICQKNSSVILFLQNAMAVKISGETLNRLHFRKVKDSPLGYIPVR